MQLSKVMSVRIPQDQVELLEKIKESTSYDISEIIRQLITVLPEPKFPLLLFRALNGKYHIVNDLTFMQRMISMCGLAQVEPIPLETEGQLTFDWVGAPQRKGHFDLPLIQVIKIMNHIHAERIKSEKV